MAEEDKTYCGQGERDGSGDVQQIIDDLVKKRGLARQDVIDAIEQVGSNPAKLEAFFKDKENSY